MHIQEVVVKDILLNNITTKNKGGTKMKKIVVVVSLVVLAFAFSVAVMAGSSGGKLIVGTAYEPEMLDSQQAHWTIWINALLVQPLIAYDSDMNVVPDLADSVDISPDGKVWTFHIMKGAKFSNGAPITAETVKEALERYVKLSVYSDDWDGVESVEVVDEYTMKIINKEGSSRELVQGRRDWTVESIGLIRYLEV